MKMSKKISLFAGVFAVATVICGSAAGVKAEESAEPRISLGVYIGNVDVGGMNEAEATSAVENYVNGLMDEEFQLKGVKGAVSISGEEMGLTADVEDAVEEALGVGKTGNLIQRFKNIKDLEKSHLVVDMGLEVDKQKTAQFIYGQKSTLNIPAEDNSLSLLNGVFTYIEGQRGEEVDIVSSVYAINDFFEEQWDGTTTEIALVTNVVEPRGSQEELARIKDAIGSYSTDYSSSSAGRAKNVENGCAKINGTVVYPGEEFSVYEVVSPFTQDNGYELAGSYANGTTVESFGGGICQVSTTLYNALIRAEVNVTMRYNHSMIVSYVKPSADAAIAGTYKDLRFENNYDFPIYIEGYCTGGKIYFNIYGEENRPANREVIFESEVIDTTEAEVKYNLSGEQPAGYYKVEQSAHVGYVAKLWKIVKVDGAVESKEVVNNSTYKMSPKIVTVGIKDAPEAQLAAINAGIAAKDEAAVKAAAKAKYEPEKPEEPTGDNGNTGDGGNNGGNTGDGGNTTDNGNNGGNTTDNGSNGGNTTDNGSNSGNTTDNGSNSGNTTDAGNTGTQGETSNETGSTGGEATETGGAGTTGETPENTGTTGETPENAGATGETPTTP